MTRGIKFTIFSELFRFWMMSTWKESAIEIKQWGWRKKLNEKQKENKFLLHFQFNKAAIVMREGLSMNYQGNLHTRTHSAYILYANDVFFCKIELFID